MKKFISILFLINVSFSFAQDLTWLQNDIEYDVLKTTMDTDINGQIIPSKYIVDFTLSKKQLEDLKSLSNKQWRNLLIDEKTDFVTCLLLYSFFEKDAFLFSSTVTNQVQWRKCCKEEDVRNFNKELKGRRIKKLIHKKAI
jgi:hypothetical protein